MGNYGACGALVVEAVVIMYWNIGEGNIVHIKLILTSCVDFFPFLSAETMNDNKIAILLFP